jgi:CRISPR-associated exonuclease Cas4
MYSEDELLMLSGIQHIVFCERQWALIHIEQQWAENVLTLEGQHMHERVDDPNASGLVAGKMVWRALPLVSYTIGLYGRADVVELIAAKADDEHTIEIAGRSGRWTIFPVEYKRGKPKSDDCDKVQLCAQALCLEEMFGVFMPSGALFYGETRHRLDVPFTDELRNKVVCYSKRMHQLYSQGSTPSAEFAPKCKSCSLINECMPKQFSSIRNVSSYLNTIFSTDQP